MDRTVPPGAALLLAFVYETETSMKAPECYDVIYGHNQGKLPKPLTSMTYGEVVDAQKGWTKQFGSSAAGAPQFMRATLIDLAKANLSLKGTDLFTADLQDRLAYKLLVRRGYALFMAGKISRTEFGKRLAQEWASLPVLASTKGAHRNVPRGSSFYMGDKLNKALVSPEKVESILDRVKAAGMSVDAGEPVEERQAPTATRPKPVAKSGRFWTWFFSGTGMGAMILEKLNIVALDWRVQMLIFGSIIAFAFYAIATMPAVRHALGIK
ncbi:hypothetical protein IB238_05700 [Rhizobium sp. ARZ01]|uniref:hypothetical protein n=1 Tax=Rhizobium sp. ARZ01 TaxID=2769313 RepID=UPI001783D15F|nr:hypothetical protein [Rhizobium sp. ARZ01]MBD9372124.1 hypothetical protein [Rhizobium sp. ARZ01]